MHEINVDRDGNLTLTYEVSITCHGKTFLILGTGSDAVFRFSRIVEKGIPEATKIECLWSNNFLVTFSGKNLAVFLRKHYPECKYAIREIDPNEEYVIDCYDMS